MIGAAPLVHGQGPDQPLPLLGGLDRPLLDRRLGQRRQMLAIQVIGYGLASIVLLGYHLAGNVPVVVPSAYLLIGLAVTGVFTALSESHFNDRFVDHYLTIAQIAANVAVQLIFLVVAPQIGVSFLTLLFLVFAFGALRISSREAIAMWGLTATAVAPILLFAAPIGLPVTTLQERVATTLGLVVALGLSAYVGWFGNTLRQQFYRRSVALQEAYRRIEELAELDELTGSFNRRCILRMLDDEIARSARSGSPCSVALIDLDWFKRINDAFGHPVGDEVLRAFSITVFANIRTADRFGRYGGEEFLLVLPDTDAAAAARLLERLRTIVAELDWSAFSQYMRLTMSAGVATVAANETCEGILARTDGALYIAKDRGRNRIVSA